jgi:hypothetical protein
MDVHGATVKIFDKSVFWLQNRNTEKLLTMYFNQLMPQNCNFGKAKRTFSEDGPGGPKHVGANVEMP